MTSPLSDVLPKAAADAVVSEPVTRRAAESLIGTKVPVPAPNVLEQIAVAVGLGGAHATGREARLAADLAQTVAATPGRVPGSLEIAIESPDAERAAQIATAVADALIADHDDAAAQARRKRDMDAIAFVDRLKVDAAAARRRLASLGGVEADPAQLRAAAAMQTANAQARVDVVHSIIASGTPPVSDRRDLPSGIQALQTNYQDVARQLATARETLGERHTTVIGLQDQLRHAAASLTAEWRRLSHVAETELNLARQHEAALGKTDTSASATRVVTIEAARRTVEIADDAVARAQSAQRSMPDEDRPYRLLGRAAVPTTATGFSIWLRGPLAVLVGFAVFWIARRLPTPRRPSVAMAREKARRGDAIVPGPVAERSAKPMAAPAAVSRRTAPARKPVFSRAAVVRDIEPELEPQVEPVVAHDDNLIQAMADLLPDLETIAPGFGAVPTIMVAANETAAGTMPAALALGRAAADIGHRVLVVEVARSRPELAMAADAEDDPILVDLYGVLRVALRAADSDGALYLAPSFEHGARIASALARKGDTPLVDEIAAEFDLVVIDGGSAAESAAEWGADAYIRIGRFASQRDDDQFLKAFGVPASVLLGTILASPFAPKAARKPVQPMSAPAAPVAQPKPAPRVVAFAPRMAPSRTVAPRRKMAGR